MQFHNYVYKFYDVSLLTTTYKQMLCVSGLSDLLYVACLLYCNYTPLDTFFFEGHTYLKTVKHLQAGCNYLLGQMLPVSCGLSPLL